MNSPLLGLRLAGTVFGLMALAQLTRLLLRTDILVAGNTLPLWPSGLAFLALSGLSLWLWKLARNAAK
ncbi:hypothetical protein [Prosthecobacter sp.]|uniref:hypothetical protein n=1 Tax=Prosthecobacter sp. TaxID=1965333 RepID=UPI002ABAE99E|nr:hypothetical protein [Prosthecobacter sp.]MDZ4404826.1 hypothetical protein [Prosthecobacter sp.]